MMQYDNLIMPDRARKAARTLKQYCEQNGCMYCVFRHKEAGAEYCELNRVPRDYDLPARSDGGIEHA